MWVSRGVRKENIFFAHPYGSTYLKSVCTDKHIMGQEAFDLHSIPLNKYAIYIYIFPTIINFYTFDENQGLQTSVSLLGTP